jgi:hypothetical protein
MKIRTTKSILVILVTAGTVFATSYCFDIPAPNAARVAEAFGNYLGLKDAAGSPRPATPAEVAAGAQQWISQQTMDYERRKNQAAFQPSPVGITATPVGSPAPSPTAVRAKK